MLFTPTTAYPSIRKIPEGELASLADNMYMTQWLVRASLWPLVGEAAPPQDREQIAKSISRRAFNPLWFVLGLPNIVVNNL